MTIRSKNASPVDFSLLYIPTAEGFSNKPVVERPTLPSPQLTYMIARMP